MCSCRHSNMLHRNVMNTKTFGWVYISSFSTGGFMVRFSGACRLKFWDVFKSLDLCCEVIKRWLRNCSTGSLTSFCIMTNTQVYL